MKKTIMGITVASVALFFWGFLFWGINTMPYETWQSIENVEQAQDNLRQSFPVTGTYFVPGVMEDTPEFAALYARGPVAMIHINHQAGNPADPMIMVQGFVLNLVYVLALVALFKVAGATEFRDFARLSIVAGSAAVILMDGGHIIWWQEQASWVIWQAIYNFTAWLIAGHLLGIFMKQEKS